MLPPKYAHCVPRYPVRHQAKLPFRPLVQAPSGFPKLAIQLRRLDTELDRYILSARDYLEIVVDAFASNVHYSTKLEGNPLTLAEVQRLTRNSFEGVRAGKLDGPRQEVLNHLAAWLYPDYYQTPWTDQVKETHRFLMEGVEPESLPGQYRTTPAHITQGRDVVFEGAKPELIAEEMDSLLRWLNHEAPALFPVVAATVFFHEFESIHPFKDGNGRTGRTLFHGYLQLHGLPNSHLCKLEYELLKDPEVYYTLLSWADHSKSYVELVEFVTEATVRAYEKAIAEFQSKDLLSTGLEETPRRLLIRAKQHKEWFRVADAAGWVDSLGEQSIRRHLSDLVSMGVLDAEGQTRARRYRFADPLRQVREAMREQQPHPPSDP